MIPLFPIFEPIYLDCQGQIESILRGYPPYSDFNFLSLWAWDTDGERQVSVVNDCLVVRFTDYITSEPFYSFLANEDQSVEVADIVFPYLVSQGLNTKMKLVPESAAFSLSKSDHYRVTTDLDNDDYILSVDEIIHMAGRKFDPKRNFINRFNRDYALKTDIRQLDVSDPDVQKQIWDLFAIWEVNTKKAPKDTNAEKVALGRLFTESNRFRLNNIGVFVDNNLCAFSINEIAHDGYGFIHFEKANTNFVGSFQFLKQATAIMFRDAGCSFINYEQDLGIAGLHKAKRSYHPVSMLKKYTVCYNKIK